MLHHNPTTTTTHFPIPSSLPSSTPHHRSYLHFHSHASTTDTNNTAISLTNTNTNSNVISQDTSCSNNETDSVLLALLRAGDTDAAYDLFMNSCSSPSSSLPSSTCLSRLLAQLSYRHNSSSFSRALTILRLVRQAGELRLFDANSLSLAAASAARSGHVSLSRSLLLFMLHHSYLPHVKCYTTVISRVTNDDPAAALTIFHTVLQHLRQAGPADSPVLLDSRPDTAAFNAALNAAAEADNCEAFRKVALDGMQEWGVKPDALTYNVVIKMCAKKGRKDLVIRVLERMLLAGLVPCATTFYSLVAAFVGFGDLGAAERVVQAMREKRRDLCLVLRECGKEYNVMRICEEDDSVLLEEIVGAEFGEESVPPLLPRTYTPDTKMYTTLMKGYMKAGRVKDVVRMVQAMRKEGETDPKSLPDHVTYTTVVSTFVRAGDISQARAVFDEMARVGVPANLITYNVLLKGYCQQLQLEKARELMSEMASAGIEPNVVSYNTLIDGYVLVDDNAGALEYFNKMRAKGIAPSEVSYTTLMKAFVLSGQPKLANKVFEEMDRDPRVKVDHTAWNVLIEGYSKLGLITEAKKLVERMKDSGLQPDVATYGSLANAIALARKPGEALLLWNEVKERCQGKPPLKPDEGLLDALTDICVRAAFFKKALEIVACMEEHGIAPNKTKYKKIYIEMHSRMFTSKHASQARQDRRKERKRAAEAFKFWLGLPNSYYGSEWRIDPLVQDDYEV